MTPREALFGLRIELESPLDRAELLQVISEEVDPPRIGFWAPPGKRPFIGSVDPPRFRIRQRRIFWNGRRPRPTAHGVVEGRDGGSLLRASFPWIGLQQIPTLLLLILFLWLANSSGFAAGETLIILAIAALVIAPMWASERRIWEYLAGCASRTSVRRYGAAAHE